MAKNEQTSSIELHLGRLVKAELVRQGRTAVWLAKQVDCTPENIYIVFTAQWITLPLLFKISKALERDFFRELSERLAI